MSPPLRVEPVGPAEDHVHLAALFWPEASWDAARWRTAGGEGWAVRSRILGDTLRVRELEQYRVTSTGLAPLDHTRFELGPDGFAEVARHRHAGGPNLHAGGIRLPAVLHRDAPHAPLPGAVVRLTWAGPLRLVLGAHVELVRGACLRAEAGGHTREQWLVQGVGEVALGLEGRWERWIEAWSGGGRSLFGGVDPALLAAPPPLPPWTGGAVGPAGIFG